jgi:hypothetical protein
MTTDKSKVRLVNDFHGSSVNVVGELVGRGEDCVLRHNQPANGYDIVRLTDDHVRRARRVLCGVKGCMCGRNGPTFQPEGNPANRPTWTVLAPRV